MRGTEEAQAGTVDPRALLRWVRGQRDPLIAFLRALVEAESPSDVPATQASVQQLLRDALEDVGFRVTHRPGRVTGGFLLAEPRSRRRGRAVQLLVGHTDTVWPLGTLKEMPLREEAGRLHGPGVFDMKAGVTLMVFALRALRELDAELPATPLLLLNSDEEIGSPESGRSIRRLARLACRAFVPEPAFGPQGLLKTARKGVGTYTVHIQGRPAHAGLDPGGGASAIHELACIVRTLHALTDLERGTTVNVGVVEGGTRSNVVAARARAEVDVRVVTSAEAERMEAALLALRPETPGVTLRVEVGHAIPPMERTSRNRRLWEQARSAAEALGLPLGETMVGGASDGSVTSGYTATLDGLGAVGDGAHAVHEHIVVDATVDRCALLAMLLAAPVYPTHGVRI
ncbi:MAG TPA: M20 family metallopeptidase [Longimicrobiales bacterium]|nr:M20 family metallopeptidase [Longimicrobiales bacterium]